MSLGEKAHDRFHVRYMREAIGHAQRAKISGMRPFASLVIDDDGRVIGVGVGSETPHNPLRHSETLAIQMACRHVGGLLHGCTLVTTHEPCAYCCGAISHAKIEEVVWGSYRHDMPDLFRQRRYPADLLLQDTSMPPRIYSGILRAECVALFDQERGKA